jgi:hypothetical protein
MLAPSLFQQCPWHTWQSHIFIPHVILGGYGHESCVCQWIALRDDRECHQQHMACPSLKPSVVSPQEYKPLTNIEARQNSLQFQSTSGLLHAISEQLGDRHLPIFPQRKSVSLHFMDSQAVRTALPTMRMDILQSNPATARAEPVVGVSLPASPTSTFGSAPHLQHASWHPAGESVLATGAPAPSAAEARDECWSKRAYLDGVRERALTSMGSGKEPRITKRQPFCETLKYNPWNVASAMPVPQS